MPWVQSPPSLLSRLLRLAQVEKWVSLAPFYTPPRLCSHFELPSEVLSELPTDKCPSNASVIALKL